MSYRRFYTYRIELILTTNNQKFKRIIITITIKAKTTSIFPYLAALNQKSYGKTRKVR